MKIILLDKRNRFRDDVRTRLLIDDERDVELVTDLSDSSNLMSAISRYQPDLIVVADNVYPERSMWSGCGAKVVGYITTASGGDIFTCDGIPHYPQIASANHLLNMLEAGIPSFEGAKNNESPQIPTSAASQRMAQAKPAQAPQAEFPYPFQPMAPRQNYAPANTASQSSTMPASFTPTPESPVPTNHYRHMEPERQNYGVEPAWDRPLDARNYEPRPEPRATVNPATYTPQPQYPQTPPYAPTEAPKNAKAEFDARRAERNANVYAAGVLEDLAIKNTTTKTVAVYSAKGGVGKTTITTELATILSMTSNGRSNYRVCLIDYNVDFGDVLTTLNLDNRGPNLTHWAADVRRRMQNGENPDEIYYARKEIEGRLQRVENSTLYALVAPVTHEDSMDIRSEEPGIILRNIIENGCFDFVICDTGNNTRDATVSALDAADVIFMIATQDVSAVNCDKSFLQTMHRVGFDVDKIRLVMNGIMPYKYTQVSVEEVEAMFPYPCVARFKRDPEVTRANNCSSPIVKDPNHEFTREMRKLVAYLTGRPVPEDKPKGGFLSFFKRKG